ncbi:signal transduction histidine kinase [Granulicella arctica]|uniref:histidine kinase n=2 Tax=Granulicella arctica TaxID=940613 RepID=A0A7Y9PDR2_9BACT|nr:signal transduction histidine kinase [Granulicella arctica]
MTLLFLLLVVFTVNHQVERTSLAEMVHSRDTFRALERQQQDLLLRQTALLSELPSLKALMTTNDQPTIADAGKTFWRTSGSDLFALMRPDGTLLAVYSNGRPIAPEDCAQALARSRDTPYRTTLLFISGRLFEAASEPISFSSGEQRRVLGYISNGYELNDHWAEMIRGSPTGQVVFATSNRVIASSLNAAQVGDLVPSIVASLTQASQTHALTLGREGYWVTSFLLQEQQKATPSVYLVLLQSNKEKTALLRELNGGIVLIGALFLLIGSGIAFTLAGTVTRPLGALLHSTRQMGRGEAIAAVPATGLLELRELGEAFEKMHDQVLSSQTKLIEGERQATIGRMASSISHDLRHYLSPIYANAEFLSSSTLSEQEREELLTEITEAARGMNGLLDAILTFSRTGIAVQLVPDSITAAVRRAVAMIRPHPDADGVSLDAAKLEEFTGWIDGKELQRAVYNLLLNACQAARCSSFPPSVSVTMQQEVDLLGKAFVSIRIRDNGEGVCNNIAPRLFEPFVSAGKESGTGLGLALVKRIAEAHGGSAGMRRLEDEAAVWQTEFFLLIPLEPAADLAVAKEGTLGVTP